MTTCAFELIRLWAVISKMYSSWSSRSSALLVLRIPGTNKKNDQARGILNGGSADRQMKLKFAYTSQLFLLVNVTGVQ